jgi:hypothetical protein
VQKASQTGVVVRSSRTNNSLSIERLPGARADSEASHQTSQQTAEVAQEAQTVDGLPLIVPAGIFDREVVSEWLRRADCLFNWE